MCKSKKFSISYLSKDIKNKPVNKKKRKKNHPWSVESRNIQRHKRRIKHNKSKNQDESISSSYSFEEHERKMKIRERKVRKEKNKIKISNNKPSRIAKDHILKGNARIKEPDGSVRSDWIKDKNSW